MENSVLKKLFRRINRGLVLGIALVLIVVTYGAISCAGFEKKEMPRIEETVENYIEDIFALSDAIKTSEVGKPVPDSVKTELDGKIETFIDKYYSTSNAAQKTYGKRMYGSVEVEESLKSQLKELYGYSVISVKNTSDEKLWYGVSGSLLSGKYAHVSFTLAYEVEAIMTADMKLPFLGLTSFFSDYYDYKTEEGFEEFAPADGKLCKRLLQLEISGDMRLVREDGEWKIASVSDIMLYIVGDAETEYEEVQ